MSAQKLLSAIRAALPQWLKVAFYTRPTGIPMARRIPISPRVDPRAQGLAQPMGMKAHAYPEEGPSGSAPQGARSF